MNEVNIQVRVVFPHPLAVAMANAYNAPAPPPVLKIQAAGPRTNRDYGVSSHIALPQDTAELLKEAPCELASLNTEEGQGKYMPARLVTNGYDELTIHVGDLPMNIGPDSDPYLWLFAARLVLEAMQPTES